jgi:hypothetical protein
MAADSEHDKAQHEPPQCQKEANTKSTMQPTDNKPHGSAGNVHAEQRQQFPSS